MALGDIEVKASKGPRLAAIDLEPSGKITLLEAS